MKRIARAGVVVVAAGALWAGIGLNSKARAFPSYGDAWIARYPTSTLPQRMEALTGLWCNTCHIPPSRQTEGSCYRLDLRDRLYNSSMTIEEAIIDLEWRDSDSDGIPNVVEILMPRDDQPGQIGYHPGLVGTTGTSPCGPTPTEPVTSQNETPVWCYANCDGSTNSPQLSPNDFLCFVNAYAGGFLYANCDGSTNTPALTPNDFLCFLNRYSAGCT